MLYRIRAEKLSSVDSAFLGRCDFWLKTYDFLCIEVEFAQIELKMELWVKRDSPKNA